ncbi:MAG: hypothetical protein AABY87_00400 [bacterium]
MLTGYNTDFVYKGENFHVQTEDNGIKNPVIVTLLYQAGKILCSRKVGYADILKAECLDSAVRELMKEQHKQMMRDLKDGKFHGQVKEEPAPQTPVELKPGKSLDEVILDYLSDDEE